MVESAKSDAKCVLCTLQTMVGLFKTKKEVTYTEGGNFQNNPIDRTDVHCVSVAVRSLIISHFQNVQHLEAMEVYDQLKTEVAYLRAYFHSNTLYRQFYHVRDEDVFKQGRRRAVLDLINSLLDDEKKSQIEALDFNHGSVIGFLNDSQKDMLTKLLDVISSDKNLKNRKYADMSKLKTMVCNGNYAGAIENLENQQEKHALLKEKINADLCKIKSIADLRVMVRSIYDESLRYYRIKIEKIVKWIKHTAQNPLDVRGQDTPIFPEEMTYELPYLVQNSHDRGSNSGDNNLGGSKGEVLPPDDDDESSDDDDSDGDGQ